MISRSLSQALGELGDGDGFVRFSLRRGFRYDEPPQFLQLAHNRIDTL